MTAGDAVFVLSRPDVGGMHQRIAEIAGGLGDVATVVYLEGRGDDPLPDGSVVLGGAARSGPLGWVVHGFRLFRELWRRPGRVVLVAGFSTIVVTIVPWLLAGLRRSERSLVCLFRNSLAETDGWSRPRRAVLRFAMRRARLCVVMSPELADEARAFAPGVQLEVVRNAVPAPPSDEAARHARPSDADGPPIVLFVARLVPSKDPLLALEAFDRVRRRRECALVVVGDGPLLDECGRMVDDAGIAGDVDFAGWLEPAEVRARMRTATVLVVTSRFEGSSMQLVEAMTEGCPVVAVDCPSSHADTLGGGRYGVLVRSREPVEVADALDRVLGDPELHDELARAGRERVRDFDHDAMVGEYRRIIDEARSGRSGT